MPKPIITPIRLLGFYQLKELLGLGDERLRMIITVGNIQPISFSNPKTGRIDKLYSFYSVLRALKKLEGTDVQMEYEINHGDIHQLSTRG